MTKKKNKKKKQQLGRKEFLFNFFSLVFAISIGIYFGARSLYYYSKQNIVIKEEEQTLNGMIISNNPVVGDEEVGLHQDSDGYYFKGMVENNYVSMDKRIYRVVRVLSDNSVKLISENYVASFMWGEDSSYQNSNVREWLEKTNSEYSGVYYKTIPDIEKHLEKTNYTEDSIQNDKVVASKKEYQDYVTTLGVKDYILASGKNSYLNNGKMYFLLGLDNEKNNLYIEEDGSIQSCDNLEGYGIRPVITLKKNTVVSSGDGTLQNPYTISFQDKNYYIDSYVKLGDDMWRVFNDNNGILKMYYYGYANSNGIEIVRDYSKTNSIFDLNDKNNIAYFLNTVYLNTLSYKDLLLDTDFYTGEISDDAGYHMKNIYTNKVTCKVGLLNIFDYNSNNYFDNFFHLNTTSTVGSMQYNRHLNGLLEESDVREEKHIVPVISINSNMIKSGTGSEEDPYMVV